MVEISAVPVTIVAAIKMGEHGVRQIHNIQGRRRMAGSVRRAARKLADAASMGSRQVTGQLSSLLYAALLGLHRDLSFRKR
jgi:hypothetical protein